MGATKDLFMEDRELNLFLQPKEEVALLPVENKKLLTANKSDLSLMASLIVEGVDDGNADPLDTLILAKKGAYVFTSIVEGLKGKVQAPESKDYSKHFCEIASRMTGVSYSYDKCNDPVWTSLAGDLAVLQEKIKAREAWLKSFSKPTQVNEQVDEDSGEVIMEARKIYPPAKMGSESIIINIK
jgi:hypothetical protein